MMTGTYIGKTSGGKDVCISKDSPNQHIIITGISGAGKSVRIEDIERQIIEEGGTVVAFDVNGTHSDIESEYFNYISAQEDGLDIKLLDISLVKEGKETRTNLVQYVMETICPRQLRGASQLAAVRKAITFAIDNRLQFSCDMEAIAYGLGEQEEQPAMGAYNHLCPVLEGGIFRNTNKKIQESKANIISLRGINPKTQKRIIEIMLHVFWRDIRIQGNTTRKFTLILDEFQNFDFQQGTVLFQMLTEVRKYGINLILATQTISIFNSRELAIINQAAIKLFFQQSTTDIKKVSEMIDVRHKEKWITELSRLRVGQAITVGALEIAGRPVYQPIITSSDYKKPGNTLLIRRKLRYGTAGIHGV